ncbi:MAG: glycosyltransferase family 4 protein [Eubacterium sp.]|jgi:glycosyltransferase involved in cell wall biosynthesis|nr:glycosyltransferase family 4 protein [Eubacterium sp.]
MDAQEEMKAQNSKDRKQDRKNRKTGKRKGCPDSRTGAGRPKTVWIIDHYSSEPEYGGISRQYDFAVELGRRGFHVVVIASGFSHFTHSYISQKDVKVSRIAGNVHYIYLKTGSYTSNSGAGRAKSMADFLCMAVRCESSIARRFGKPDAVTGCSVHPLAWAAAFHASRRYHARFLAEVRDFWPRVWTASGEKKPADPAVLFFGMLQWLAFHLADRVIYSMCHGDKYICGELGIPESRVYFIGQPVDCGRFDRNREKTWLLPEEVRAFMEIGKENRTGFYCTFAGYYMAYEGVYVMLEAQRLLEQKGLPVRMVFAGSGPEKGGMEAYAAAHRLENVLICGRLPKEAVPALLSHSDVCMAHLEVEGHPQVYRYGVSKNKVCEYLYSGACTLYGFMHKDDEAAASGGGLMFEPHSAADLAAKIEQVYRMPESRRKGFGENGRSYIRRTHSVQVLADRLEEVLFR